MKFSLLALDAIFTFLSFSSLVTAKPSTARNDSCITPRPIPDYKGSDLKRFGVVLFRAPDMVDVFGPLDPLQIMALSTQQMQLHFIAETLDPITTAPSSMNPYNSSFYPTIPVTNTFDDDLDLDVLIVPGGPGVRAPDMSAQEEYIKKMYPKVKILITVCTGAGLAAKAGVLDGKIATTNKNAWDTITGWGEEVHWVAPARYTVDGNVWTSSGVTSALDLIFAFIGTYWGNDERDRIAGMVEHVPSKWDEDPFTEYHGIAPTKARPCDILP